MIDEHPRTPWTVKHHPTNDISGEWMFGISGMSLGLESSNGASDEEWRERLERRWGVTVSFWSNASGGMDGREATTAMLWNTAGGSLMQ